MECQRIYQRKFCTARSSIPRKSRLAPMYSRDDDESDENCVDAPSNYRHHTNQTLVFPATWQRILTRCAFSRRLKVVIDDLRIRTTRKREACHHLTNSIRIYSRAMSRGDTHSSKKKNPYPNLFVRRYLLHGTFQFSPFKRQVLGAYSRNQRRHVTGITWLSIIYIV